jgi:cytochrome c-type protein NapB
MIRRAITLAIVALAMGMGMGMGMSTSLLAQSVSSGLRGATPLDQEGPAQRIMYQRNTSEKETRNYPEQPPVIPHTIEVYQIDLNSNKYLSCHARARTGESQTPMVSITHFMDRNEQFLASVSPRRFFFCTSCHVPQSTAKPPVMNDFVDIDTMLQQAAPGGGR